MLIDPEYVNSLRREEEPNVKSFLIVIAFPCSPCFRGETILCYLSFFFRARFSISSRISRPRLLR
ncbi:MAG: hypothetical protein WBW69_18665, partial [Candidatus Korobacteraceae bacterium]